MTQRPILVSRSLAPALGAAALVLGVSVAPAHAQTMPTGPRIKDVAGSVWFGLRTDQGAPPVDLTIFERECNAAEFTHYPAWGGWPARGSYGEAALAANVAYFRGLGVPMVMHMFVGPNLYLPDWLKDGTWDQATLEQLLQELITNTIASGEAGTQVDQWNVVNEALSWDGTGWEESKFLELGYEPDASGLTGDERVFTEVPVYVRRAFEFARLSTTRTLELRDYDNDGIETRWNNSETKSRAFYQLVHHLLAVGAPVDAVGLQGHFNIDVPVTWSQLTEEVQKYRALGLEVHVTEMDAQQNDNATTWDATIAARQEEYYYNYVKAALAGDVQGIFVWGIRDNQDQGWRLGENAVLFDESGDPKPAYYGVQRAFVEAAPTATGGAGGGGGLAGAPGMGGVAGAPATGGLGGGSATGGAAAAPATGGAGAAGGLPASGGSAPIGGTSPQAVPSPAASEDAGGCGCSVPARDRPLTKLSALLGLALVLLRRAARGRVKTDDQRLAAARPALTPTHQRRPG